MPLLVCALSSDKLCHHSDGNNMERLTDNDGGSMSDNVGFDNPDEVFSPEIKQKKCASNTLKCLSLPLRQNKMFFKLKKS